MRLPESLILVAFLVLLASVSVGGPSLLRLWRRGRFRRARELFHWEREKLETRLVKQIAVPVIAGEMEWLDCEFADEVLFLRDRTSGRFVAMVLVTLGVAEDWSTHPEEATHRCGVAIFRYDGRHWSGDPKVYMDLTPNDVLRELGGKMELVCRDIARQAE